MITHGLQRLLHRHVHYWFLLDEEVCQRAGSPEDKQPDTEFDLIDLDEQEQSMIDYELLRVIWWCLVGVLLIGFAIPMASIWALGLLTLIGKNDKERRVR